MSTSSSLTALPKRAIHWQRLANCHIFRIRCSRDGSLGASTLSVSTSCKARFRADGIFFFAMADSKKGCEAVWKQTATQSQIRWKFVEKDEMNANKRLHA